MVPKPVGNVVPAPKAAPAPPPNPSPNKIIPPGHKWALVPDSTPATIQIFDKPEPEPSKPNEELRVAQTATNKLQRLVEAAMICLIEQRTEYPLEKFGITEAYLRQRKIKVLSGTAAIGSLIIAGIEYLKIHSLPCVSQDRLLGRCKFLSFNEEGALHNFTDLSTLTTQSQEERLNKYKLTHQKTVSGFLDHFVGIGTFHQRPEVTVKQGVRCTTLQDSMMNCGVRIKGFQGQGWNIVDVMEKLENRCTTMWLRRR